MKLNLGCGLHKEEGYINIDKYQHLNPDICLDFTKDKLPFKDNSVDEVKLDAVISYIDDLTFLFKEIYRVSKDKATVKIITPHFSYGFGDPYHKKGHSIGFINFVNLYAQTNFKVNKVEFGWLRAPSLHNIVTKTFNNMISFFANLNKNFCERVWCYWLGGFEKVEFELEVVKDEKSRTKNLI